MHSNLISLLKLKVNRAMVWQFQQNLLSRGVTINPNVLVASRDYSSKSVNPTHIKENIMANVTEPTVEAELVDEENEYVDDSAFAPSSTNVGNAVATLNDPSSGFYSTLKADTFIERLALGKAVNESTPLDEALNEEFDLANYIVQVVDINDSATGEQIQAPRVTLIDKDGKAYHGTSKGLLTAIRNLNATIGDPSTWEGNTIRVKVVEEGKKPRRYMTIKYI